MATSSGSSVDGIMPGRPLRPHGLAVWGEHTRATAIPAAPARSAAVADALKTLLTSTDGYPSFGIKCPALSLFPSSGWA